MLNVILIVTVLLLFIAVVADSFVDVPTGQVGVRKFFSRRLSWKSLKEGLHLKWPFVIRIAFVDLRIRKANVETAFVTQAPKREGEKEGEKQKKSPGLQVFLKGTVDFVADPYNFEEDTMEAILEGKDEEGKGGKKEKGRVRFLRTGKDEEVLRDSIIKSVSAEVSKFGSVYTGTDFSDNRDALSDLINCILRLSRPPHVHHDESKCGVNDCQGKLKKGEDVFSFYRESHADFVKSLLDGESENREDMSPIELRYGVDILVFNLSDVDFTEDAKEAFEEAQEMANLRQVFIDRLNLAKMVREELGASAQVSVNLIESVFNEENATRIINSIESEGSSNIALIPADFSGSKKGGKK